MNVELVLYEPKIPQNTGNIGRLCVGFKVSLSLIEPLGFVLNDKNLKRAGLDYWQYLKVKTYQNFESFYQEKILNKNRRLICFSKYATISKESNVNLIMGSCLKDFKFHKNDIIIMGSETTGFPDKLISKYKIFRVSIPILGNIRSYNLANSVAIALFEVYKQLS